MTAAAPRTLTFAIWGPIARDDLPGLCARVCALLEDADPALAFCDVAGVDADAVTVDALARLQLAAGRRGCRIHLRRASPALRELVGLLGLRDVLPD
jgi:ABC-type transporter Mla MlaB component